jgi:catechol 2,3-dioxygenase-like lactoylglutathione lyase family enzyme
VIDVERVDFVAMGISDLARSDAFYGDTLGLARNLDSSGDRWVEYETGNLTVALSQFGGAIALGVDDVNAARETLEGTGVAFHRETFDSGVCNGAPFTDPDGNRLLLHHRYAPLEPYDKPATEMQRTDFVGVNVTDRERAGEFYGGVLGLERNPLSSDEWPEYTASNVGLVLSTPEQKGEDGFTPYFAVALRVPDVAASMERLRAGGVEPEFPDVYDSGVCHMAFVNDPDGNPLILHRRYAPYPDGSLP